MTVEMYVQGLYLVTLTVLMAVLIFGMGIIAYNVYKEFK
jgi:hypothetical protein